ncbi:19060_t:CDS:2 [Rhizophagus irregularis]|nr:19060_t:CDS:2 [Rhizophagus irregularis]
MNHLKNIHESNFTEIIDNGINNLQLINVAQVENTSSSVPNQASNATNGYVEDNQFATSAQSYPTITYLSTIVFLYTSNSTETKNAKL